MDKLYYILIVIIVLVIIIMMVHFFLQKNKSNQIIIEKFDFNNYYLPKIIWVYWNDNNIPTCIQNILKNNTSIIKEWKINFFTDETLSEYIPNKDLPSFENISIKQKSDWIRLYLLEKYGGCWLDAGIIINNEIAMDKLRDKSISKKSLFTGFYLDKSIIGNDLYSYVEAWFIMAPKNSSIIKTWRKEFEKAIYMSFFKYKKMIKKNKKLNLKNIYSDKYDVYLAVYACFYNISQYFDSEMKKHIILYKAEDTMYKIHKECNWDHKCIQNRLDTDKTVKTIPYIKLNGGNRENFNLNNYSKL